MNCPVCKSPNPNGVAYCQMCYESFNRSAADTYLRAVRREKYSEERKRTEDRTINRLSQLFKTIFGNLDTDALRRLGRRSLRSRYTAVAVLALIGIGAFVVFVSHWAGWRDNVLGRELRYPIPPAATSDYLVGFHNEIKTWSERNGELDSPLEEFQTDDIGNVEVVTKRADHHSSLVVRPREWIVVRRTGESNDSHTVSNDDPSLTAQLISLDQNGFIAHRPVSPTLRVGRALGFLAPAFPHAPLRLNREWKEPVQWVERMGDWKWIWTGTLTWTFTGEAPCGEETCAHLTYHADVTPKLLDLPGWAAGGIGVPSYKGTNHGDVLFDPRHRVLIANTYYYDGLFRVPLHDLGRIPLELRVGRRIEGLPGTILIQFSNRVDIRKN